MQKIVKELPFTTDVKEALLGRKNELGKILDEVLNYEKLNWNQRQEPEDFKPMTLGD